jgi:hypothetical protein
MNRALLTVHDRLANDLIPRAALAGSLHYDGGDTGRLHA